MDFGGAISKPNCVNPGIHKNHISRFSLLFNLTHNMDILQEPPTVGPLGHPYGKNNTSSRSFFRTPLGWIGSRRKKRRNTDETAHAENRAPCLLLSLQVAPEDPIRKVLQQVQDLRRRTSPDPRRRVASPRKKKKLGWKKGTPALKTKMPG